MQDEAESTGTKAKSGTSAIPDDRLAERINIPVWLHATESFYKKLNRVANKCGVERYEALSRGLDACCANTRSKHHP
jgi:hypothetical protein